MPIKKIISLAKEYAENAPCQCEPSLICWRCLFAYNLNFLEDESEPLICNNTACADRYPLPSSCKTHPVKPYQPNPSPCCQDNMIPYMPLTGFKCRVCGRVEDFTKKQESVK